MKKRRGVSVQSELPNVLGRIGSVNRLVLLLRLLLLRIIICRYKVLTVDRMDQLAADRADEHSVVLHDVAPIPVLGGKLDDVAVGIVANLGPRRPQAGGDAGGVLGSHGVLDDGDGGGESDGSLLLVVVLGRCRSGWGLVLACGGEGRR